MRRTAASDDVVDKSLDWRLLRRIFGFVWPHRALLAGAVVLLPLAAAFELAQPYLLKIAIDDHVSAGRLEGLDRVARMYLLTLVGQYGAAFGQLYLTQLAGQRAMNNLRLTLHRHVLSLSQRFFDRTPIGRLMTRITSDVESLNEMFAAGLVTLVADVFKLALILVAIFALDARLALFSLAILPVVTVIALYFRRLVRDAFREVRALLAQMNSFLQEHLAGIKVVQAFAQEVSVGRRFEAINVDYRQANTRAISADAALYSVIEAVGSLAVAGLLWHGGARIVGGTLTFGVLVAFIEYLTKFFIPIRDLSSKYAVMQQAMTSAERVFSLLDTKDPDAPTPPEVSPPAHARAPSRPLKD